MLVSNTLRHVKKPRLTPTFAKVNISLKNSSFKPKWNIATLIMDTEMQHKHSKKRKLKKELKQIHNILKRSLNLVVLNTVFRQLNMALKSKFKVIANRHQKKLKNLKIDRSTTTCIKYTIYNYSPYQLTTKECTALSYGLDHYIPCKFDSNIINTDFEQFYQSILKDVSHIPENNLSRFKRKLRNTCEKYSKIHVPYKNKKVIDKLSRNKAFCILKQDTGGGFVLMDRTKYTNKCLEVLQTDQLIKLNRDPTKSIEGKIQRIL